MNKKFSTLMALALLAGSTVNFTNAEELRREGNVGADFKSGETYYLAAVAGSDTTVYGFQAVPGEPNKVTQVQGSIKDQGYQKDEYKNFLWTVTEDKKTGLGETPAKYGYTLTNLATGKTLTFDNNGNVDTDYSDNGTLNEKATFIYFGSNAAQYKTYSTAQIMYDGWTYGGSGNELFLHGTSGLMRDANGQMNHTFCFVKYKEGEIEGSELNDLYNSIGFNMYVDGKDKDAQAAIKNLFATSGRVLALDVPEVKSPNHNTDGAAYPKGTYFVTSVPAGKTWKEISEITDAIEKNNAQYAFLEGCTFIAVNSVANDINGKEQREGGIGFQLTTVTGRNLQKYQGIDEAKKATGRDIAVVNACFHVKKDVADKYAIGLYEFRYNKAKAADITDQGKQEVKTNFWLNVTEVGGEAQEGEFLTTHDQSEHYIFTLKDIATTSVYSWLKNEKKMSAYNIQFVSDNDDINGKYLFVPAYGNKAYAKGAKFTDTNMPETQFVVTDVDATNNTVTFTNRANRNMNEAVKIYAEADGTYTIALENKAGEFAPLNVLENGDIKAQADIKLHGLRVNITPVENVDYYYGAWDVDNLTEVTLLFARDNTPTSNKLYVKHPGNVNVNEALKQNALKVTNELEGTLQFRLVKSKEPVEIPYGYAYYLGEAGKEQEKWEANGDTIAYYTYQLEAYYEGKPCDQYLTWTSNGYQLSAKGSKGIDFIIKDNVDGSVQLINDAKGYGANEALFVNDWKNTTASIKEFKDETTKADAMTQEMKANYVKTYLNMESPETSLDPASTYITMKNDINSYYLAKTADGEAILDDATTLRLFVTDADRQVPNFLVSTGWNETTGEREFLFNPQDSVNYYVAKGEYNKKYQWDNIKGKSKLIFKTGKLNGKNTANDTIYTSIKGVDNVAVTNEADQNVKNVQAGLNYFKFQIVADPDADGLYMMRQNGQYLASQNGRLTLTSFGDRKNAIRFEVADVDAPTANESINAADNNVVVAGINGAIVVKGAEGKNVIVSTILGKVVANEVVSSDNATIAAPAGIVVVSVDGESFKVVVK